LALTELTQDVIASAGQDGESAYDELALVDLSALDS